MDQWSIFNEKLIEAVRLRPALFDKTFPDYKDKDLKDELWCEIGEQLLPSWKNLSSKDKILQGKELQRKWQNMRTCFARELKRQKCMSLTPTGDTRKPYMYYRKLLFLLPTLKKSSVHQKSYRKNEDEEHESFNEININSMINTDTKETATSDSLSIFSTESRKRYMSSDDQQPSTSSGKKSKLDSDEIDEDKYFLLSLVPSFKKLNYEQKIEVKIEFLRVLRSVQISSDRDSLAPSPLPSNILSPSAEPNMELIDNERNCETRESIQSNDSMSEKSFDDKSFFCAEETSVQEFYCETKNFE